MSNENLKGFYINFKIFLIVLEDTKYESANGESKMLELSPGDVHAVGSVSSYGVIKPV